MIYGLWPTGSALSSLAWPLSWGPAAGGEALKYQKKQSESSRLPQPDSRGLPRSPLPGPQKNASPRKKNKRKPADGGGSGLSRSPSPNPRGLSWSPSPGPRARATSEWRRINHDRREQAQEKESPPPHHGSWRWLPEQAACLLMSTIHGGQYFT